MESSDCDNWEIRVSTPSLLHPPPDDQPESRLSPRSRHEDDHVSTLESDECWTINIKSPATLDINTSNPDTEGFKETIISELEEDKGNFLCGPEWKVKIMTKADQLLDIKQIQDGNEFRVLISPTPPETKKVETKRKISTEKKIVTQKKVVEKKAEKKVVKVEVKGIDNRYLRSGGKIFFKECPLYHKSHPWVMPLGLY